MLGLHEAMAYCENLAVGILTLLASALALYVGMPLVALLLCFTLLVAQAAYKIMCEGRGYEMLLVCSILFAVGISGAMFSAAALLTLLLAASVYDCCCHRRLRLSNDGIFARGARADAESSRDIGMGGCIPSSRLMGMNSSGH